jgi:hypothetical protein
MTISKFLSPLLLESTARFFKAYSELDSGELHEVNSVTNAFVRVNKQRQDVHAYK